MYLPLLVLLTYVSTSIAKSNEKFDIINEVKKNEVVFIGESHTSEKDKDIALTFIDNIAKDPELTTFAFEHGMAENQLALEEYIRDQEANIGTLKELYYICRISNDNGIDFNFEEFKKMNFKSINDIQNSYSYENRKCGTWQRYNFYKPSLEMFRKMRDVTLRNPSKNFKFCPVDVSIPFDTTYKQFLIKLGTLSESVQEAFEIRMGSITKEKYLKDEDAVFQNAYRDFAMADNLEKCSKGRKGILVQAGAYHSQDTSYLLNQKIKELDNIKENISSNSSDLKDSCIEKTAQLNTVAPEEIIQVVSFYEAYKIIKGNQSKAKNFVMLPRNRADIYKNIEVLYRPFQIFLDQNPLKEKNPDKFILIQPENLKPELKEFLEGFSLYIEGYSGLLLSSNSKDCSKEDCL